jgi:hypothetical protein
VYHVHTLMDTHIVIVVVAMGCISKFVENRSRHTMGKMFTSFGYTGSHNPFRVTVTQQESSLMSSAEAPAEAGESASN